MTEQRTPPSATEKPRIGELERLGPGGREALVIGVDGAGFDALTLPEKRFAYLMYRASIPGNAIAYRQTHRHADTLVRLLEAALTYSAGLDPAVRSALHDYLKLIWVHHGPYNHHTHAKFVPATLTPEMLSTAVAHAVARGATFPGDPTTLLSALYATIFDATHEPVSTFQSAGADIIEHSAVNYYDRGITRADIEALPDEWQHRMNVRFARGADGAIVPEVFKIGGLYGKELETIAHFVQLAIPHAENDEQRAALRSLLEFYTTGDEKHFREHMVHWLQSDARVDYLNGFIESYLDPRGTIAQFEANASLRAGGGLIEKIAENASYFEARMPWPDKYKRTDVSRPVATIVNVLIETGDGGPVSPAAYNLPNYNDIRNRYGSKNVILNNIENTRAEGLEQLVVNEFYLPEYRDAVLALTGKVVRPLHVYLHEIIGHGSGRPDPALTRDPRAALGRTYSALEECRADLVGLYAIGDPRMIEFGAYEESMRPMVVETSYITYLQSWMSRMDRVEGDVREAHDRGHHAILMWLVRGGESGRDYGVEVKKVEGDYFVRIRDAQRVHAGVSDLLSRLQVIKSTGDVAGAQHIFDEFGTKLDPEWRANIAARRERLKLPKLKAFVFPHLKPVIQNGEIVDVTLTCDEDLTAQQLRFRRLEHSRELTDD